MEVEKLRVEIIEKKNEQSSGKIDVRIESGEGEITKCLKSDLGKWCGSWTG